MPRPIPPDVPPLGPAPRETGSFLSDGLKLTYEVHGEGATTLVFHPGVGFPREYFRPLVARLESEVRCVLLNPRGVGESEGPENEAEYDLPFLARDVARLVEALGLDHVILYGHSLGANVVAEAAIQYPEIAERVFLSSYAAATDLVLPFTRWVRDEMTPEQRAIIEAHEARGPVLDLDVGFDETYADAAGAAWSPHVIRQGLTNSVAWSMGQYERPAAALWGRDSAMDVTGLMTGIDQRGRLVGLRCPVHLLFGRFDQYAAPTVPICQTYVPRLTVDEVAGSNHHAHVEEPARVAEIVRRHAGFGPRDGDIALRIDVRVDDDGIFDELTTRRLPLEEIETTIVGCFGADLTEVSARVARALGDDYDADQVSQAVAGFVEQLREMAFLDEGLSGDDIERRQLACEQAARDAERWDLTQRIVDEARKVPFHRERIESLELDPDEPESFRAIPVMVKADIRANFPDRLVPEGTDVAALLGSGELALNATSGSTDERLQVLFDYRVGRLPDAARDLWRVHPTRDLERGAVFTSPVCAGFECHLGKLTMEERIRDTTLTLNSCDDPMHITDEEVRAVVEEMREFRPHVLFTNPWYAVCLLRVAQRLGLEIPRVESILSSYQYLTLRHRRLIEAGFRAPVFSYYGATDLGGSLIGTECAEGHMHVREDHIALELLGKDGVPVGPGEIGKVTVTTLRSPFMPLIRYEVGDLARWAPSCDCPGGQGWACIHLEGRHKDVIAAADGRWLTTRVVDEAIGGADLDFYRLSQDDSLFTLEAVPAPNGDLDRVKSRLQRLLGPDARLIIEEVRSLAPERSLKFRQTVSHDPGPPSF